MVKVYIKMFGRLQNNKPWPDYHCVPYIQGLFKGALFSIWKFGYELGHPDIQEKLKNYKNI